MAIFCKNCGKELEADEKFCGSCGRKVNHHQSANKENSESKAAEAPKEKVQENLETASEGSGYKVFAIILVLAFVGFIIYAIWAASSVPAPFTPPDTSTSSTTAAVAPTNGSSNQTNHVQQQNTPTNASANLTPSLINQIEPNVVEVNCYSADESIESSGSGISARFGGVNYIETNYHVLGDAVVNGQSPDCYAVFPEPPNFLYNGNYGDYQLTLSVWHYNPDIYQDVAMFTLGAPVQNTVSLSQIPVINDFYNSVRSEMPNVNATTSFCMPSEVAVGDAITVFGYPKSGNLLGISETITSGVISGILPGTIYKTDAPIDHGNSGGIAILNKNLCSLGIPTLGESGLTAGIGYIQSYILANDTTP